ncbi:hypothetical protein [Nitrosomonas sp. Is37]|uniref:hypothetical protein n=1 Tax=Nitrosomonas sp. Is37 TaxID=3080535 RepID=UPI00294B40CF|nr:hypothetical protein [Nitrosomonas sp. Is37]MDV6343042.1 hypothetical protein [Nitrosomonas sp. Is37]
MGDPGSALNKMHAYQACIHISSLFRDCPAGLAWSGRAYRIQSSAAEFHAARLPTNQFEVPAKYTDKIIKVAITPNMTAILIPKFLSVLASVVFSNELISLFTPILCVNIKNMNRIRVCFIDLDQ